MSGCELSICGKGYTDKGCVCYPNLSVLNNMTFDTNDDKNQAVKANQICAYESAEGYLFPCDAGCCEGGCPGQCPDVAPRPPQKAYTPNSVEKSKTKSSSNLFILWAIMTVIFLYLSIVVNVA